MFALFAVIRNCTHRNMINRKKRRRLVLSTLVTAVLVFLLTCYHQTPISNFTTEVKRSKTSDNIIKNVALLDGLKSDNISLADTENLTHLKKILI